MAIDMNRNRPRADARDLLNRLQADLPNLVSSVATDGSTGGVITQTINQRLEDIKNALPAS